MYELRSICCIVRLREYLDLRKSTIVFFVFLSVKAYPDIIHHHHRFSISRRSMTDGYSNMLGIKAYHHQNFSPAPRHATPALHCPAVQLLVLPRRTTCLLFRQIQGSPPWIRGLPLPMETGTMNDELCTIGNSRGAPIRGLLGPWDAFGHWDALGLTLLAGQSATSTH